MSFSFLSIEWRAIRTSLSRRVWCSSFVRSSQRFYPCRNVRAHVAVVVVGVRDIFLRMCLYVPLIVGRARETIDLNLSLELTVGCIGFGRSTEFSFLDSSTMTFTWDAKNNFILSHGVTLYQPQATTAETIHWPSIVNEIRLEISSTPSVICWPDGSFRETHAFDLAIERSVRTTTQWFPSHWRCVRLWTGWDVSHWPVLAFRASLYSTLKHRYLQSLCQKIEADQQVTLEIVYELVRHVRAKRIDAVDIEKVFTEWNSQ